MDSKRMTELAELNWNVGRQIVFILDNGFTKPATIVTSFLEPEYGMHAKWASGQMAVVKTLDEGKVWKFIY